MSQIAMVGARAREVYDQQAKERQKAAGKNHGRGKEQVPQNSAEPISKGDARAQVGKAVGVSGFTIDCATKVLAEAEPELVKVDMEVYEAPNLSHSTRRGSPVWRPASGTWACSTTSRRSTAR